MANEILAQDQVTDGYDVRVSRDGKPVETVHFHSQPANVQAAVDAWAAQVAEREVAEAAQLAAEAAAQAEADSWTIGEA